MNKDKPFSNWQNGWKQCGRRIVVLLLITVIFAQAAQAGILITSNGISIVGGNGVQYGDPNVSMTGADGGLTYRANGISLVNQNGSFVSTAGAASAIYTGNSAISMTGADGISMTGADGIVLRGTNAAITMTGADGNKYQADAFELVKPAGISLTNANGITAVGVNGVSIVGANISMTGADGISMTGADGAISMTGADGAIGIRADGTTFSVPVTPNAAITMTGADGAISMTGADSVIFNNTKGVSLNGVEAVGNQPAVAIGLLSVDPELAVKLNQMTDDSTVNAVVAFYSLPTSADLQNLQSLGIVGGTRFRQLPFVVVSATRTQIVNVSKLANVRSIYAVRSLDLNADVYFKNTQAARVAVDRDLQTKNNGAAISGRGVTVAILDTGVNAAHNDLSGRVVQNVRLVDSQSAAIGFNYPSPVENLTNTDLAGGHGTFVSGIVAGSGVSSGGKYNGVAPGARILGLSAGDVDLINILAGFDYILDKGANYNVRVVNCSFSANTVYDPNDPVNIATKMLAQRNIVAVFSAGNSGAGDSTLNPFAAAPWVVSVGATDQKGNLADFSSRGRFGDSQFAPTLVAPGVNVVSLRNPATETGVLGIGTNADAQRLTVSELPFYTTASGTSFSAPQVAGAVALMLEANPNLTFAQIKDILARTATPLPPRFRHEVGAGMLNTYAAVLEAGFANRHAGLWRAVVEQNQASFLLDPAQNFEGTTVPGLDVTTNFSLPADTLQTTVRLAWGNLFSTNDLGLRVADANGVVQGESNNLNAPGLGGRRETVTLKPPPFINGKANVYNTLGLGSAQKFYGSIENVRLQIGNFADVNQLSVSDQAIVRQNLQNYVMLPFDGNEFRPNAPVSRYEFAQTLVRGARVPQYLAGNAMFGDVRSLTWRDAAESVQTNPNGALIYDAAPNGNFRPNDATTRLVAVVALVKAAGLTAQAQQANNQTVAANDAAAIPVNLRGYVVIALQNNLIGNDGDNFSPNKPLTRIELARAMAQMNTILAR